MKILFLLIFLISTYFFLYILYWRSM